MTLAQFLDRYWLAATDDAPEADVDGLSAEAAYKLGFANALQVVGQAHGRDPEVRRAVEEAVAIEEGTR
jgi:hypothetical protein